MSEMELTQLIHRVNEILAQSIDRHRGHWNTESDYTTMIFDEIDVLVLGGGKRLRPQFCYWGWVAAGGDPAIETPLRLGAAIELVHAMALFHDDVIDDAATRRGQSTVHRRQSQIHEQHQ
ncbi:MAG: geranylgeranyl pyrophosphate synthase, partial [Actinomycetota bacterium]